MSHDLLKAIGARIERQLGVAHEKRAGHNGKLLNSAKSVAPFALPDAANKSGYVANSHQMSVNTNQVDLAVKASTATPSSETECSTQLTDLVNKAAQIVASIAPVALTTSSPEVSLSTTSASATLVLAPVAVVPVAVAASADNGVTSAIMASAVTSTTSVPAAAGAMTTSTDSAVPAGATRLPDGTLQFGYAPVGGVPGVARNVQPAVPPEFGVGATFRMKGIAGPPLTVTRVGDGVVTANVYFPDGFGTREIALMPSQLELITSARTTG